MNCKELLRRIRHWIRPGKHCWKFCPGCEFFDDCEWETQHEGEEYRCEICLIQDVCPAFNTGVIYPCPHFEEVKHGKEEQ